LTIPPNVVGSLAKSSIRAGIELSLSSLSESASKIQEKHDQSPNANNTRNQSLPCANIYPREFRKPLQKANQTLKCHLKHICTRNRKPQQ